MESGLKPGTGREDSCTQALLVIFAFPDKLSGMWSSGIMFMSSVDTTWREKEDKLTVGRKGEAFPFRSSCPCASQKAGQLHSHDL